MASISRLHNILTATNIAAGGFAVLAHGLNVQGVAVLPEFIDIENGAFDVTAFTTTTITVQNISAAIATGRFEVQFRHSMVRADGPPVSGPFTPIGVTPFIRRGSNLGAGGTGNLQSFRYTVTGAEPDLADFMVPLPAARSTDVYRVTGDLAGATVIVGLDFPDLVAGDRTTTDFRLQATAALTAGDQIDFHVFDAVP